MNTFDLFRNLYYKARPWLSSGRHDQALQLDYQFAHRETQSHQIYSDGRSYHATLFFPSGRLFQGQKVALLGFLEFSEDFQSDCFPLEEIKALCQQRNIQAVLGPVNASTYRQYRLKVDHFNHPPYWGEPQNSPRYLEILKSLNFEPAQNYTTYVIEDKAKLINWLKLNPLTPFLRKMTASYQFKSPFDFDWEAQIGSLFAQTQAIFGDNLVYTPISREEFDHRYGKSFRDRLCPLSSRVIFTPEGDPVGAGLCFSDPDSDSPQLLVRTLGIDPDHRLMGATYLRLIHEMAQNSLSYYQRVLFCLMKQGNLPDLMGKELADQQRLYQLFSLDVS